MPKPRDEVRVFLVGGSTTECLYLDDRDALHAVVQRDLQERAPPGTTVKVYGAGKSGDRSDDHVAMIVHRILLLAPDAIVVFAGFNDLIATLRGYDYVTHAMPGQPADHRITFGSLARMTATETQVGRRMYYFLQRYTAPRAGVLSGELPLRSSYREAVERRRAAPRAIRLPALDLQPFEVNLRTIAGAVNAHGVALVLMTQQTTWDSAADPRVDDWHWMRYVDGVSYTATAMHAALEAVNGVTRRVGRELAVPVYDLASSMPKSLEFFYDDVHFNVRGAAVAGAELANVLQQAHLFAGG